MQGREESGCEGGVLVRGKQPLGGTGKFVDFQNGKMDEYLRTTVAFWKLICAGGTKKGTPIVTRAHV